jgi:four helix bundle protein
VPANIAEGHGRSSTGAFINHLSISHGSLMELETHLMLANHLNYCSNDEIKQLLKVTEEVGKMIQGLRHSLEKN